MAPLSLRRRFLIVLLPVVVAGPLVVGLAGQWSSGQQRHEFAREQLETDLQRASLPVLARMQQLTLSAEAFARHWTTGPDAEGSESSEDHWVSESNLLLDQWPEVEEVFLSRPLAEGRWVARVRRGFHRAELLTPGNGPAWVRDRRTDAAPSILHAVRLAGRARLWWALDAEDSQGTRVGVLLDPQAIPLRSLLPPIAPKRWFALLSSSGAKLSSDALGLSSPGERRQLRALGEGDWSVNTAATVELRELGWLVRSQPDPVWGLTCVLAVPSDAMGGIGWRDSLPMTVVTVLAALFGALIIVHLVRRVSGPLDRLGSAMQSVAAGDLQPRLEIRGSDEMVHLSRSFNSMVTDLHTTHEAMDLQRRALSQALREAESVERMKDDFLALVSHEVRTPLTTIMGGIEFLLESIRQREDTTEIEFMTMVQDSARRLGDFMNDAILMANLQSRGGEQAFEEFSLQALVAMELERIRGAVTEREIACEDRLATRSEVFVEGDWTLFQVAVEKLLDNAWRHNRQRGRLRVDLVECIAEDDGEPASLAALMTAQGGSLRASRHEWRALRVMNTGACLKPDEIPALFERFELSHDIDHHQRGSGLSLPIVNSIVEYHGGCVQARPIPGEGMAFYLVLSCRDSGFVRRASGRGEDADEGIDDVVRMARQLAPGDERETVGS